MVFKVITIKLVKKIVIFNVLESVVVIPVVLVREKSQAKRSQMCVSNAKRHSKCAPVFYIATTTYPLVFKVVTIVIVIFIVLESVVVPVVLVFVSIAFVLRTQSRNDVRDYVTRHVVLSDIRGGYRF